MNNYFNDLGDKKNYFADPLTSSTSAKAVKKTATKRPADEARATIQRAVNDYNVGKSTVVIRRLTIK